MISAVLIIPAALKPAADAVGAAMGWGPENYGLALSATGQPPTTHYLCRTDVSEEFLAGVANPPPIPGISTVLAALDMDLSEALWGEEHTKAALASRGLSRVREDF